MKATVNGGFALTAKKIAQLAVMVGLITAALTAVASGATPYFKTYGSDVFTGGWFDDDSDSCNSSVYYQKPGVSAFTGGIDTVTKTSGGSGAPVGGGSSQYGVLSVGRIAGTFGSDEGFYSAEAASPTRSTTLSFANNNADAFGGTFEGAGAPNQGNCIPDYYTTKRLPSAIPFTASSKPNPSNATGQWWLQTSTGSPLDLLNADVSIPTGNKLTIFVKGDVYIDGNIRYAAGATEANVQKFALVAEGNIYVDPAVTQLDGLYIAQPDLDLVASNPATGNTGVFWTCHPNNNAATLAATYPNSCTNKLTVNGAVIAKQLKLLRTSGDIGSASLAETPSVNTAAEVFNYTPEMFIGGPFFNPVPPSTNKIQSLISLPPVF